MTEGLADLLAGVLELLVVGAGALAWVVLGVLAITDQPVSAIPTGQGALVTFAGLAALYVLGVVIDRIADLVLDPIGKMLDGRSEPPLDGYNHQIARMRLSSAPALFARSEYLRARLRVARGWSLNALVLAVVWPFYATREVTAHKGGSIVAGEVGFALLAIGCLVTWRDLRTKDRKATRLYFANHIDLAGEWVPQPAEAARPKPRAERRS